MLCKCVVHVMKNFPAHFRNQKENIGFNTFQQCTFLSFVILLFLLCLRVHSQEFESVWFFSLNIYNLNNCFFNNVQTMLDVICENFDRYTYSISIVHKKAEAMDKPATNIWKKSKYYQQCDMHSLKTKRNWKSIEKSTIGNEWVKFETNVRSGNVLCYWPIDGSKTTYFAINLNISDNIYCFA